MKKGMYLLPRKIAKKKLPMSNTKAITYAAFSESQLPK